MWLSFWLNNFHFALEFFGAVILFALSWLALDAYLIKKEFKALSKTLGFLFFALWLIVHSLNITSGLFLLLAAVLYPLGLLLILLNLFLEKPPERPKFEAVLILPAVASILWQIHIIVTIFLLLITVLAVKRYLEESQKSLKPFCFAFVFLAVASALAIFNDRDSSQGILWISEHVLKIIGFGSLGYWGWQYLKLRMKEEMLLIFISMALFIGIVVTFTFSAILLQNMENEAQVNLISNVKVLDYSFSRMKNEALADAQVFAQNGEIIAALTKKDFAQLEKTTQQLMLEKSMDFLTVTSQTGEVILRAHALTVKGDSVLQEKAGTEALKGIPYATIEFNPSEKFSIRGASPIYDSKNNLIGAVITGFIIDNAFADRLKGATGLEATIYQKDTVQATTIFDSLGKTRNTGAKLADSKVLKQVFQEGQGITGRTTIFSKPFLAAYLPLKNTEGDIVGVFQTSRLQTEIVAAAAAANRLTLFITIIIVIMMLMPAYWFAKKLTEEI